MPEPITTATPKPRNIEKDASTYWLSHAARLKLQAIARKRHLKPPALLELLTEELAPKYLSEEEIAAIEQQAQAIEDKRRQKAETA